MNKNQNNLTAKINEQMNFYKAHNTIQPIFSKLNSEDIKAMKEENRKLESILNTVDNPKTNNPNDNQANLNEGYIPEEKPSLLSRISSKFNSPWVKYPLIITGGGILLSQVGCAGVVTPVEESYYISGVSYVQQAKWNWCLPASGAMVLNYYGVNITQEELAKEVIGEDGLGYGSKLIAYAKKIGFKAEYSNLSINDIKYKVQQDIPIIALQDRSLNNTSDHARVIIGYDDKKQEIITNDPDKIFGEDYKISYSDFLALNISENPDLCKSIVIYPKN